MILTNELLIDSISQVLPRSTYLCGHLLTSHTPHQSPPSHIICVPSASILSASFSLLQELLSLSLIFTFLLCSQSNVSSCIQRSPRQARLSNNRHHTVHLCRSLGHGQVHPKAPPGAQHTQSCQDKHCCDGATGCSYHLV